MPVDQYSPCPCGSGKKMKFCKCVEQPQDYETLVRLIEGGQELAAMDRINQLLAKTPNAAWLLALKGELALGLQELEVFRETAQRFLKLKPDNPLAMIMNSIACSLAGEPVENAAHHLLGGLAESRDSLPSLTLLALEMLINALGSSGKLALAGYWGELQQTLVRDQQTEGASVLQDHNLNLLAKVAARLIDDPPGAPWKERLAEVISLSRIFSFAQAETKLRAILRDFPDQAGPLSQLLRAQMIQLNQSGAHTTANKLSLLMTLPQEERSYFGALALELEPEQKSLRGECICRYAEIDSLERIVDSLTTMDTVVPAVGQSGEQMQTFYAMAVNDEVPAKRIFTIFDRAPLLDPARAGDSSQAPQAATREFAAPIATVVLFGKQTDKPARAMLLATRFPDYQAAIDELLQTLQLGNEIEAELSLLERSLTEFLTRSRVVIGAGEAPSFEERGPLLVHDFLNLPLPLLDGASPKQAAGQERYQPSLLSLLSHLEGEQSILVASTTLGELYQQLGLERPTPTVAVDSGNLKISNILDLDRIDFSQLSDSHLQGVTFRCMALGASRALYQASSQVRARESLNDNLQLQVLALSSLQMLTTNLDQRLEITRELLARLEPTQTPVGKIVIDLVSMLSATGRFKEAEETMVKAMTNHPDDPHLLSFMQYVMQQRGGMGGPGARDPLASLGSQSSAAEASGGLVLPGQQSSSAGGESKLWLPGS